MLCILRTKPLTFSLHSRGQYNPAGSRRKPPTSLKRRATAVIDQAPTRRCEAGLRRGESNPLGSPRNRPSRPFEPLSPFDRGHERTPRYSRGHQTTRNSGKLPTRVRTNLAGRALAVATSNGVSASSRRTLVRISGDSQAQASQLVRSLQNVHGAAEGSDGLGKRVWRAHMQQDQVTSCPNGTLERGGSCRHIAEAAVGDHDGQEIGRPGAEGLANSLSI